MKFLIEAAFLLTMLALFAWVMRQIEKGKKK
jgi:hypothetical protein